MPFAQIKPYLLSLHRWAAIVLAPVFIVMILSGTVLSFRPIVDGLATPASMSAATVDVPALESLLAKLGQDGQLSAVTIADGGQSVDVTSTVASDTGRWNIADGSETATPAANTLDVFGVAERIHKSLVLGLGFLVDIASFAMLAIMLIGPLLSWLRFRNTLMGWHLVAGWIALPITIISPLTAVAMILGISGGGGAALPTATQPVSISQALTVAAPDVDLSHLVTAHTFRGGTVMLQTAGDKAGSFAVTESKAVPLTGGPGLIKQIHEGTWAGAWSGALNFVISLVLLGLTVSGLVSWFRRRRREKVVTIVGSRATVLVAHASQTGTATAFANATAKALASSGIAADVAPIGTLAPQLLTRYETILLIAASTGDGDVPDAARRFLGQLQPGAAKGVSFAELALGDRSYDHFCGGGEKLRTALIAAGATERLPMVRADGDPAPAWTHWMATLRDELGLDAGAAIAPTAIDGVSLTLRARQRLDDPTRGDTQETWSVTFESDADLEFRPGDLLRLTPAQGGQARSYSVGSSSRVDPRHVELTVTLHRWQDDDGLSGFGLMSQALTHGLPLGSRVAARLDPHPAFNPPNDPTWPVMMIGAGSGVAPYPGFLSERAASGRPGPAWLIFGNRHRDGDFLWSGRFRSALKDGSLTRLDTAFSRDAADRARVQTRIEAQAGEVFDWIAVKKAVIYICGRREMADGVLAALARVISAKQGSLIEAARGEIDAWLAEGRIRVDAFD